MTAPVILTLAAALAAAAAVYELGVAAGRLAVRLWLLGPGRRSR